MIYICKPCVAYVGVHKGTNRSLGRLANHELREWKKKAHAMFDPLWQAKISNESNEIYSRKSAYKWLSEQMGLDVHLTHIGMMDIDQCKRVVELCTHRH